MAQTLKNLVLNYEPPPCMRRGSNIWITHNWTV